ncbi:helix-turn-helix domain-containing protein [Paenibacillus lycopersici]|uniref:Helix-turn-helix domain-containing protein n=1 Tax=Paenibacillus lycopersici TaxID=2704462 RepID=A0A6C0G2H8_9BACL|nr:helix-turn-helix domain-containing protein [Paenibacillus lycopersici]QHT60760.1 helix-turn-helix domain-containing protein [Paenibacillus lycopersici]
MSDLGALLKKAREQRNLSLDDIQDLTKIRKRYLEAIEEGDYSVLPGSFYVRAFVKNYAESVGLDAEEVLRLYNREIPSSVPEQVIEPVQRPRRARTQSADRLSRWGFRVLMWSFLLLIVVLVYVFAIKQPNKDNVDSADQTKMTDQTQPPASSPDKDTVKNGEGNAAANGTGAGTDTTQTPEDQTPPEDQTTPPAPTTTLTLDRTSGTTDYYNVSPAGKHTIEMKANGTTWVGIYLKSRTGKMVLSQTIDLQKVPSVTYEADGPVYINVAHAKSVEITVDGVAIDDGNKSGSHHVQLTPVEGTAGTTDTAGTTNTGTTTTP